jgi:hypothetical protein
MSNKHKDEILEEYDFRGKEGVRGKYHKALQEGYKTVIHKSDGSMIIRETRPIFLEPDIREHFPDSESVNKALRKLIELLPDN